MASCHYFDQKALCTVIMRISPVLLLLPVLVLTGSAAIANDDRPASPQPAIASPVPAPLTIKSLTGTYKGVVNEQSLAAMLKTAREIGLSEEEIKDMEAYTRRAYDQERIIIDADGTFEVQSPDFRGLKLRGKARLDANRLILSDPSIGEIVPLTLDVSSDGKFLLLFNDPHTAKPFRKYMKQ